MPRLTESFPAYMTARELAGFLDLTEQSVHVYAQRGVFKRKSVGIKTKFNVKEAVKAYASNLKSAGSAKNAKQKQSLNEMKIEEMKLRMSMKLREIIPLDEAIQYTDESLGELRSLLLGMSARITTDLSVRDLIDDEVRRILTTVVNATEKRAVDLEAGSAHFTAPEENDSDEVGTE